MYNQCTEEKIYINKFLKTCTSPKRTMGFYSHQLFGPCFIRSPPRHDFRHHHLGSCGQNHHRTGSCLCDVIWNIALITSAKNICPSPLPCPPAARLPQFFDNQLQVHLVRTLVNVLQLERSFIEAKSISYKQLGFPGGGSSKEPTCQHKKHKRSGFDP